MSRNHQQLSRRDQNSFPGMPPGFILPPDPFTPSSFITDQSLFAGGQPPRHPGGIFDVMQQQQQQFDPFSSITPSMPSMLSRRHHDLFDMDFFNPMPQHHGSPFMMNNHGHMMGMEGGGGGTFHSTVMMMSSTVGPDGAPQVERYMKTSRGNTEQQIHEVKEAYSDSHRGLDKMAIERELRGRGTRVLKERNRHTQEMIMNDEPINMNENEVEAFNNEWRQNEEQHLPRTHYSRALGEQEHGNRRRGQRQLTDDPHRRHYY